MMGELVALGVGQVVGDDERLELLLEWRRVGEALPAAQLAGVVHCLRASGEPARTTLAVVLQFPSLRRRAARGARAGSA